MIYDELRIRPIWEGPDEVYEGCDYAVGQDGSLVLFRQHSDGTVTTTVEVARYSAGAWGRIFTNDEASFTDLPRTAGG